MDTNTTATRWAAFLKERRNQLGVRQIPLAERLGVSQATVSRWEQGTEVPPARHHAALIEELEITPDELHALYRGNGGDRPAA